MKQAKPVDPSIRWVNVKAEDPPKRPLSPPPRVPLEPKVKKSKNPVLIYDSLGESQKRGRSTTVKDIASQSAKKPRSGEVLKFEGLGVMKPGNAKSRPISDYRAANANMKKGKATPQIIFPGEKLMRSLTSFRPSDDDYRLGGLGKPEPRPPTHLNAAEKEKFRMEYRTKMFGGMLNASDQTILEKNTVYGKAREKYLDTLEDLDDFVDHCLDSLVVTETDLDRGIAKWLASVFLPGESIDVANYMVAVVKDRFPRFRKQITIERVECSMKGWRRLQPSRSRKPMPKLAIALLMRRMACCVWIGMEGYLRPGDLCHALRKHLLKPLGGLGLHFWVLQLHLVEERKPSKTLAWDEGIMYGLPQHRHLHEVFSFLKSNGFGDTTPSSYDTWGPRTTG